MENDRYYKVMDKFMKFVKHMHYYNVTYDYVDNRMDANNINSVITYDYINHNESSFLYIDDFDSLLPYDNAVEIINKFKKSNTQAILVSYNSNLMTNDLLRHDCYQIIQDGEIHSLDNLTNKDLKKSNDLNKMFLAGSFKYKNI